MRNKKGIMKNKKKNKDNKNLKYLIIILVVLLLLSIFVMIIYGEETKLDREVKNIYEKYKDNIDLATNSLYENPLFISSDSEGQRKSMGLLLDYYEKDNKIRSVYYDGISYLYMFVYTDENKYGEYGTAPLRCGEVNIDEEDLISDNIYKDRFLA